MSIGLTLELLIEANPKWSSPASTCRYRHTPLQLFLAPLLCAPTQERRGGNGGVLDFLFVTVTVTSTLLESHLQAYSLTTTDLKTYTPAWSVEGCLAPPEFVAARVRGRVRAGRDLRGFLLRGLWSSLGMASKARLPPL